MESTATATGPGSRLTEWLRGFWTFYREYTRTAVHAAATAGLTAFGLLVFIDPSFALVAILVYVVPPVVIYTLEDGETERRRTTGHPRQSATDSAPATDDGAPFGGKRSDPTADGDSDTDGPDTDSDTDTDSDGGDTDSDTDSDNGDTDTDSADGDTDGSDGDTDGRDGDTDGSDGDTDSDS